MTDITFQRVPGSLAPSGAPVNPLTNIRQLVEPPVGAHRNWLIARGWPFAGDPNAAYRTASLSRTYFALQDAGLFEVLDLLILSNGVTVGGSLLNCIAGKPDMTNSATSITMVNGAMVTNGVSSSLSWALSDNASNWAIDDAELFINATVTPPGAASTTPIVGGSAGGLVRLSRNSGNPYALTQLNCSSATAGTAIMAPSDWRAAMWSVSRSGGLNRVFRDGVQLADRVAAGTMAVPTTIYVGRNGADGAETYGEQHFTSFGLGRALTDTQRAALARILIAHGQDMAAFA